MSTTTYTTALTAEEIRAQRKARHNTIKRGKTYGLGFYAWNEAWNASGAASANVIGKCMKMAKEAQAGAYEEWYVYYMERKQEGLLKAAKLFYTFCLMHPNAAMRKMDFMTALDFATIHAIDESWEGHMRERTLRNELQERINAAGYTEFTVVEADDETDSVYMIDAQVINSHGRIIAGVQIKPPSFFSDFEKAKKTRLHIARKHAEYREETGAYTYFLHYQNERGGERLPLLKKEGGRKTNGDMLYHTTEDLLYVLENA